MEERIKNSQRKRRRGERGVALIAVLCLLFSAALITSGVLCLSQTSTYDVRPHVELQRSAYINEGVSNRIQYLIAADRSQYSNESLGQTSYSDFSDDRFLPDGVTHKMDYYGTPLTVRITDAQSGFDLSSAFYQNTLTGLAGALYLTEDTEPYSQLSEKIKDYLDSDNDASDNGLEDTGYQELERQPLPRNSADDMIREELFYLPGFTDLFAPDEYGRLSQVRLIGAPAGAPSFFTATPLMLKAYCNLEDDVIEQVISAREEWFQNQTLLQEQLDGDVITLMNRLSRTASSCYTVEIGPDSAASKRPSRRLIFTFDAFQISGAENNNVQIREWFSF